MTDEELVKLLKEQDETALLTLIRQYGPFIQQVVLHNLYANYERDYLGDILNRCYYQIWNKANQFHEDKGSFKNWISAVAKNQALDYRRGLKATFQEMDLPDNVLETDPAEEPLDFETLFKPLSKTERQIFELFFEESLSVEEVAQQLHLRTNSVYQHLSRGRKKIKQEVDLDEFIR